MYDSRGTFGDWPSYSPLWLKVWRGQFDAIQYSPCCAFQATSGMASAECGYFEAEGDEASTCCGVCRVPALPQLDLGVFGNTHHRCQSTQLCLTSNHIPPHFFSCDFQLATTALILSFHHVLSRWCRVLNGSQPAQPVHKTRPG